MALIPIHPLELRPILQARIGSPLRRKSWISVKGHLTRLNASGVEQQDEIAVKFCKALHDILNLGKRHHALRFDIPNL